MSSDLDRFEKKYPRPHYYSVCTKSEYVILKITDRFGQAKIVSKLINLKREPHGWKQLEKMSTKRIDTIRRGRGSNLNKITGAVKVKTFVFSIDYKLGRITKKEYLACHKAMNPKIFRSAKEKEAPKQIQYWVFDHFEYFNSKKEWQLFIKIREAALQHRKVQILYRKKGNNRVVRRIICPYAIQDGYFYCTDNKSGKDKAKSFIIGRIRSAKVLEAPFKPTYDMEL